MRRCVVQTGRANLRRWGSAAAAARVEIDVPRVEIDVPEADERVLELQEGLNTLQTSAFTTATSGRNLLLIGAAGTGKSHVTRVIREVVRHKERNVAACAPFGVAACNVNGFTIHSTFGLPMAELEQLSKLSVSDPEFRKLRDKIVKHSFKHRREVWESLDTLIIDEVSTCDALTFSLLDYIARVVKQRNEPFGGVQVICVGDFLQLPPVHGDWAFNSPAFQRLFSDTGSVVQLKEVLRQSEDIEFLEMLNYLRTLHPDDRLGQEFCQALIKKTCRMEGDHDKKGKKFDPNKCTRLVPLRRMADKANAKHLDALTTEANHFHAFDTPMSLDEALQSSRSEKLSKTALNDIDGMLDVMLNNSKFDTEILLKKDARVMQTSNLQPRRGPSVGKNSSADQRIANGHTGVIKDFVVPKESRQTEDYKLWASLRRKLGQKEEVPLVKWDHIRYETPVLPHMMTVGDHYTTAGYVKKRLQLPICLSWAVTAHKCQGMTISGQVAVSLASSFAPGQIYVALSRSKTGASTFVSGMDKIGRGFSASKEALNYLGIKA
eukprot:TRINITY_DN15728_c0_g1_i1.p1 TRINITY_DN15728_c0_g1~~TRINITY_DN15728_c0_g1_i1.p1  ORF type:complete len:549 (+),score=212.73 TRINITY_DN15728_c0_g1_i1:47-1693(+)